MPSGRKFSYVYDAVGGLSKVRLPSGTPVHSVSIQNGFGHSKLYHRLPGFPEPHVTYWSHDGRLLKVRPPGLSGFQLFKYSPASPKSLERVLSGDQETLFAYHADGWLKGIEHSQGKGGGEEEGFTMKLTELHDAKATEEEEGRGRMRVELAERRISFGPRTGYAAAKFEYGFEASAGGGIVMGCLASVSGRIGAVEIPDCHLHQGWGLGGHSGRRRSVGQFFLHLQSLNMTTISDAAATFSKTSNTLKLLVNTREVVSVRHEREPCRGQIIATEIRVRKEAGIFKQTRRYKYDDDGMLVKATVSRGGGGNREWRFRYDPDGNLIKHNRNAFAYDDWGRLQRVKDARLVYDGLGRVVVNHNGNKFDYTTSDLVRSAKIDRSGLRINYHYDHEGRLVGRKDTAGNSTQYFYSLPDKPNLVTHVYWPLRGALTSLVYDDDDKLIYADIGGGTRYYVVTDDFGSPTHFVTTEGKVVKEVSASPYGSLDSGASDEISERIPIGFAGGIADTEAGIIHLQKV